MDFCWQMDSDEVVHEDDTNKIRDMLAGIPNSAVTVSLPVIEYWGSLDKVRIDIQPWKWRISKNLSFITHGIPKELRRYDDNGHIYCAKGTDGCDIIDDRTGERIPNISFYRPEVEHARQHALAGNVEAQQAYNQWFENVINSLPSVFHFSWFDMERKVRNYKYFWGKFWKSLYNTEVADTAENNMMFDKPWSEVTEEDIVARAKIFKEELGGWIWHQKWDGKTKTPHMTISRTIPSFIRNWVAKNGK